MMFLERVNSPLDLKQLKISELVEYAGEVRELIVQTATQNGGHLSSNLGAVELTIALHYVFDCEKDKILFDVGHQSYTHKIITGRRDSFHTLRQNDGISGFPSPDESDADLFCTGHSSSSLSLALGMARARDLLGQNYDILPVIGDGSFTGGMVYEALNDIGENKTRLTIVLNDNKMSISKNTGAISKYFTRLRLSRRYIGIKTDIKKAIYALSATSTASTGLDKNNNPNSNVSQNCDKSTSENPPKIRILRRAKSRIKELFLASRLFENFGISYYGPIDGHNLEDLIRTFRRIKLKNQPSIIHVVTKKGKGEAAAEQRPDIFHGLSGEKKSGESEGAASSATQLGEENTDKISKNDEKSKSFSHIAGNTLANLAEKDDKIVAITAAMMLGTGLDCFAARHKTRYFDVSIAEQHAVSLAAGLAKSGLKPFFAVYSTFLQRGFDQVLHEVTLNNLPVRFLIDRAGLVGSDGVTHQGIFDLSYLSLMPNMTIASPKDGSELEKMIEWAGEYYSPICIRYPKDFTLDLPDDSVIELGKWQTLKTIDSKVYLLAVGSRMVELALQIENANIINARFIKPLDNEFLLKINNKGNLIITLEDNILRGGFGESVLSHINQIGAKASVKTLALPNHHIINRDIKHGFEQFGLTKEKISAIVDEFSAGKKH